MKRASLLLALSAASLAGCGAAEDTSPPVTPSPAIGAQPGVTASPTDPAHGLEVYRQACAFCHDRGTAGAPKIGDALAWGPRLARGVDALRASALQGKGAMPPKGGNPALTEPDIRAAVDHLVAQVR